MGNRYKIDTISSTRGKNRLLKHKDRHVTHTLRLLKMLYDKANEDNASYQSIRDALALHIELMAYLSPKLQAIAPATLDDAGNLNPLRVRQLANQVELELEDRKLLPPATEDTFKEIDVKPDSNGVLPQGHIDNEILSQTGLPYC